MFFLLPFLILLLLHSSTSSNLDDSSPQISYSPQDLWLPSSLSPQASPACTNSSSEACLALQSAQLSLVPPSNKSAFGNSWHLGVHLVPNTDEDDEPGRVGGAPDQDGDGPASSSSSSSVRSSSSSAAATPTGSPTADGQDDEAQAPDADDTKQKGKSAKGSHKRRSWSIINILPTPLISLIPSTLSSSDLPIMRKRNSAHTKRDNGDPFETPSLDADDPGFVDVGVNASITFTGSSISLYAILPLFSPSQTPNAIPTLTNISFLLDGVEDGSYLYQGVLNSTLSSANTNATTNANDDDDDLQTETAQMFSFGVLVYERGNLNSSSSSSTSSSSSKRKRQADSDSTSDASASHTLTIRLGPNSVFLLDYAVVSSSNSSGNTTDSTGSGEITSPMSSNHNVATFAGAVGGTVGILSLLAFGLFISIRRRRYLGERRARRERESRAEDDDDEDQDDDIAARGSTSTSTNSGSGSDRRINVTGNVGGSGGRRRRERLPPYPAARYDFAQRFTDRDHGYADEDEEGGEEDGLVYEEVDAGPVVPVEEEWSDGEVEGGEDGTGRPGIVRRQRSVGAGLGGLGIISLAFGRRRARQTDSEEGEARGARRPRRRRQPNMSQVHPTPFVPRYFPGTMPASPPPYPAVAGDSAPPIDDDVAGGAMVSLPAPVTASASASTSMSVSIPYRRTNDPAPPFAPSTSSTTMGSPSFPYPSIGQHNALLSQAASSSVPPITPPAAYVYPTSGETNRTHLRPPLARQASTESAASMGYADRPPPTPPPGELELELAGSLNEDEERMRMQIREIQMQMGMVPSSLRAGRSEAVSSAQATGTGAGAGGVSSKVHQPMTSPVLSVILNASRGAVDSSTSSGSGSSNFTPVISMPAGSSAVSSSTSAEAGTLPGPVTIFEHMSRTNSRRTTPASSIKERGSPVQSRAGTPPPPLSVSDSVSSSTIDPSSFSRDSNSHRRSSSNLSSFISASEPSSAFSKTRLDSSMKSSPRSSSSASDSEAANASLSLYSPVPYPASTPASSSHTSLSRVPPDPHPEQPSLQPRQAMTLASRPSSIRSIQRSAVATQDDLSSDLNSGLLPGEITSKPGSKIPTDADASTTPTVNADFVSASPSALTRHSSSLHTQSQPSVFHSIPHMQSQSPTDDANPR